MITRLLKPLLLSAAFLSGCCHGCPPPAPPPHGSGCGLHGDHGEGPHGRGPHGHFHAPPPEAFAACEGKAENDACTVAMPDRAIEGTCRTPPPGADETRLACVPSRADMPPPPGAPAPDGGARTR